MNISLEYVDYTSLPKDEQNKIFTAQNDLIARLKIAIRNKLPDEGKKIQFPYMSVDYIQCLVTNNMQIKCTSPTNIDTDNTPAELEALANLLMSMRRGDYISDATEEKKQERIHCYNLLTNTFSDTPYYQKVEPILKGLINEDNDVITIKEDFNVSSVPSHVTGPLTTNITITNPPIRSSSTHTDDHHLPNLTERMAHLNLTNITINDAHSSLPQTTVYSSSNFLHSVSITQPDTEKEQMNKLVTWKLINLSSNNKEYNQIIQLADKVKISLTNSINSNTKSKQAASLQSETESFKSQIENITSFIDAIKKIQESVLKMSGPIINLNETGIPAQVSSLMDKYILPAIKAEKTTLEVQVIKKTLKTLELSDFYEHNSVSTNETQRLFQQATDDPQQSKIIPDTTPNKNRP